MGRGEKQRGTGVLSPAREAEARRRVEAGETQAAVALSLGVSKNVLAGLAYRHGWRSANEPKGGLPVVTTSLDRMDALDRNLAAVLRQYPPGCGRVPFPPPAEKKPRARDWAHR